MPNLNKVMLMGNLTRDPELKYLPSQTAVCDISIAVNRRWTDQEGQTKEEVTFIDCSMFGKRGEVLAKYLKKGNPIYLEGRLKLDQWEAQDGSKRSKMRVVVENFEFLGGGKGGNTSGGDEGGEGGGGYAPRPAPAARAPYRPAAGRPAPQQQQQAAPQQDMDQMPPDDVPPPIKDDDIPF